MKKSMKAFSIGGIATIVIAVTLSVFFLSGFEKTIISRWALAFVLLSEAVLFSGIAAVSFMESLRNKAFLCSGIASVLPVYFIATAVSCLFANAFKDSVNTFIVIEIMIIAATAIIIILLIAFSYRVSASEQKTVVQKASMQACESRIYNLMADSKLKDFEAQLNDIYEKIKYSDKIGASSADDNIVLWIGKLETQLLSANKVEKDINDAFDAVLTFLAQRNMEIGQAKRGGF